MIEIASEVPPLYWRVRTIDSEVSPPIFSTNKSGGTGRSEDLHGPGATVGEQMRIGYRESEDDIPMDHREKPKHDAVRRESPRRHAYGAAEGDKTRDRKLPRSVQATVQVEDLPNDNPHSV